MYIFGLREADTTSFRASHLSQIKMMDEFSLSIEKFHSGMHSVNQFLFTMLFKNWYNQELFRLPYISNYKKYAF